MPSHCCVPLCTKKGYRDDNNAKISYFIFPKDKHVRKQWTHAIRREEGKSFQIVASTKVCSRHFKDEDFIKTLAGKICLKPGAVPSKFPWRTSPRKRKPPPQRNTNNESPLSYKNTEISDGIIPVIIPEQWNELFIATDVENEVEISAKTREVATQTDFVELKDSHIQTDASDLVTLIKQYDSKVEELKCEIQKLSKANDLLQSKLFTIDRFRAKDSSISFYTSLPNNDVLMEIYNYLDPGEQGENIRYYVYSKTDVSPDIYDQEEEIYVTKKGRPRYLRPIDEYFLVLCRLRQGFAEEHLGDLFHVSTATVSRTVITWVNFMYLRLGIVNIWPSRESIDIHMPEDFKAKYKSTRVIIDCTEIRCQMPSSLHLNGELFSSYKNHTTLKGLIGISPSGAVTFVSSLYTGSISDREIVYRSGFLDLPFNEGDSVMADKGFTIEDLLPLGIKLNIPPFLGSSNQMPAEEVIQTQEIASLRIHVERVINKIKNFHIFDGVIPLNQLGLVNQIWAVCALLCNGQRSVISV